MPEMTTQAQDLICVDVMCPEVSPRALMCHIVDLTKVDNGHIAINFGSREDLAEFVGVLTQMLER